MSPEGPDNNEMERLIRAAMSFAGETSEGPLSPDLQSMADAANQASRPTQESPEASLQDPFPANTWDDLVAQGDPEALGICDPEKAAKITEQDLVNLVSRAREESARARMIHEANWRFLENTYYLHRPNRDSFEWQSQITIPEVYNKIRVAISLLQGALGTGARFFDLIGVREYSDDEQIRFITRWLEYTIRKSRLMPGLMAMWEEAFLLGSGCLRVSLEHKIDYRPHVKSVNIYNDPQQAQMATMQGLPTTREIVSVEPVSRHAFRVDKVPIWSIYPDPLASDFYQARFIVEETEVNEEVLKDRLKSGVYDSLDDIGEPVSMDESSMSLSAYERRNERNSIGRRHLVQEYTGNIYDAQGHVVAKNMIITVINKRSVVRVGPNPIWSGKSRYIWSTPIPREGALWGRSLVDSDANIQREMENLLNLMLDDIKYAVLGAFQIDQSLSDEPNDIDSIEPGRIYRGRGAFIQKIQFSTNISQAWPVVNYLQSIGDKSTQISEFVDGSPSSRGRPTAAEVNSKTQAGQAYMQNLSRRLEEDDVERAIGLLYELLMQFGDNDTDPELIALLESWGGPQTLSDEVQRMKLLDAPFRLQVRGISMLMRRGETVERLMQLSQLSQQIGAPPPNQLEVLYMIILSLGFTPEQLGYPPSADVMKQQQLAEQMAAQQAAMMENGGGGGVGPGGTGSPIAGASTPDAAPPPPPSPEEVI